MEIQDTPRIVCTTVHSQDPPPEVQAFVRQYGGLNRFGEPNFRIVWGGSRMAWKISRYARFDDSGNKLASVLECRWVPKYRNATEYFILEWWKAPEAYFGGDRDEWLRANTVKDMGEICYPKGKFPSRGDYEPLGYFADLDGVSFAQPEISDAKYMIDKFRYLRAGIGLSDFAGGGLTKAEFDNQQEYKRRKLENDEILGYYDQIKDATRPSLHNPWVSMTR